MVALYCFPALTDSPSTSPSTRICLIRRELSTPLSSSLMTESLESSMGHIIQPPASFASISTALSLIRSSALGPAKKVMLEILF